MEKRKLFTLPGIELRPLGRPAHKKEQETKAMLTVNWKDIIRGKGYVLEA
jgi:hypothetical protein